MQARSRSDNYAAVLRLQNTQPKDRRIYTAFTGILAEQRPHRETAGYHRAQAGGGQRRKAGQRQGQYFLSAPFTQSLQTHNHILLFLLDKTGIIAIANEIKTVVKEKIIMKKKFVAIAAAATLVMAVLAGCGSTDTSKR